MTIGLRPLREADWEAVHDWARRLEVCRYQVWGPNTPEQTYEFVADAAEAWRAVPQQRYTHVIEVDGATSGLATLTLSPQQQGEIAYSLHPRWWGHGIATAAARGLLELGFGELSLHRIFGTCDPRNLASARVLTKLGMSLEGRLRENMLIRDGWRDSEIYSILDREWTPPPV